MLDDPSVQLPVGGRGGRIAYKTRIHVAKVHQFHLIDKIERPTLIHILIKAIELIDIPAVRIYEHKAVRVIEHLQPGLQR